MATDPISNVLGESPPLSPSSAASCWFTSVTGWSDDYETRLPLPAEARSLYDGLASDAEPPLRDALKVVQTALTASRYLLLQNGLKPSNDALVTLTAIILKERESQEYMHGPDQLAP